MKRTKISELPASDDLRPEYALNYAESRPNRFASRMDHAPVVVALDPDVSRVFTTPESVNAALRALIAVVPNASKPKRSRPIR